MMRSMFSGVSGLRTHQSKMDVIAHNISNVNTVGYKSSRATFSEVFSQTLSGASRANDETGRGGTNPMQIGLGVNSASIDKDMSTGAAQRTDRALDLMINGDGFFIVGDESGTYFTRAGAFDQDEAGYIVMSGSGMRVYGWDTKTVDGVTSIQKDRAEPIQITGEKEYVSPSVTAHTKLHGNLNTLDIENSPNKAATVSVSFYDSLGNRYITDLEIKYDKEGEWTVNGSEIDGKHYMYPNGDRTKGVEIGNPCTDFKIKFDETGRLDATQELNMSINIDPKESIDPPADFGEGTDGKIKMDISDLTQFGTANTSAKVTRVDGNAPGSLQGMSIGSDGIITGRYSNGDTKIIGQIPIAIFKNPAGMESIGNNLFVTTNNSGDFDGVGQETGDIMGGVLEMSNVDLSSEFTEMITTQRGFQANSRVITTSDDMLQELVNLKR